MIRIILGCFVALMGLSLFVKADWSKDAVFLAGYLGVGAAVFVSGLGLVYWGLTAPRRQQRKPARHDGYAGWNPTAAQPEAFPAQGGSAADPYAGAAPPPGWQAGWQEAVHVVPPNQAPERTTGFRYMVAGLGAVMLFGCGYASWRCWLSYQEALKGPTLATAAEIGKADRPETLTSAWVKFKPDRIVPTDVRVIRRIGPNANDTPEVGRYCLLQVGDRWLIARFPTGPSGGEVKGRCAKWTQAIDFEAIEKVTASTEKVHQGRLMPFQFDGDQDVVDDEKWALIAAALGAVAGAGLLVFAALVRM